MEWAIMLGEFDIRYDARKALKAQVLADFVAEILDLQKEAMEQQELNKREWKLFINGAVSTKGTSAVIILQGLELVKIKYMVCLNFPTTNNVAEYETLIAGLSIAKKVHAECLVIHSDS